MAGVRRHRKARRVTPGGCGSVLGPDTVAYLMDAGRGHTVPEGHYRGRVTRVLVVDRYAAYKAISWVKDGVIVLAFCWAHVRRNFIRVGKGWPELKPWALQWLRRIRPLYRLNDRRPTAERGSAAFREADDDLGRAVAAMKAQRETELGRVGLATPCRKALESLDEHWEGLTRLWTTRETRWITTPRNGGPAAGRWGGRTSTAREPNGVAGWRRRCSRSWPRCRCGSSIPASG